MPTMTLMWERKATKLTSKLKFSCSSTSLPFRVLNPPILSHNTLDVGGARYHGLASSCKVRH